MSTNRDSKYNELLKLKDERLKALENEINRKDRFIFVQMPLEREERVYREKIGELSESPFFSYYLARLQHHIMDAFTADGNNPEFYRGQMALISTIISDSEKARKSLDV